MADSEIWSLVGMMVHHIHIPFGGLVQSSYPMIFTVLVPSVVGNQIFTINSSRMLRCMLVDWLIRKYMTYNV